MSKVRGCSRWCLHTAPGTCVCASPRSAGTGRGSLLPALRGGPRAFDVSPSKGRPKPFSSSPSAGTGCSFWRAAQRLRRLEYVGATKHKSF